MIHRFYLILFPLCIVIDLKMTSQKNEKALPVQPRLPASQLYGFVKRKAPQPFTMSGKKQSPGSRNLPRLDHPGSVT